MLISELAITMNLMAIGLLAFLVSAALLSVAWLLFGRFVHLYSMPSQKALIWIWVLAPWALGLVTVLIFSPLLEQTLLYDWIKNVAHWHHLYVFDLNSWHGITVILFVMFSVGLIAIKGRQLYRQSSSVVSLKHFSISEQLSDNTLAILKIDSDIPTAFTSGFFSPVCYVSKGLADKLSPQELDIVLKHELAHVRNRDPLSKLLIAFLSAYYPNKIALRLNAKYALITEHLADQSAALHHTAENVAATLVKVTRLQNSITAHQPGTTVSYFGTDDVVQRVQQLLSPVSKPMPLLILAISILLMLCFTVMAVDATHHLVEVVFTHS
jgi:hypothetical protein